jgi:hypothetical protein
MRIQFQQFVPAKLMREQKSDLSKDSERCSDNGANR